MRSALFITLVAACLFGTSIAKPVRRDENPLHVVHDVVDDKLGDTKIVEKIGDITHTRRDTTGAVEDAEMYSSIDPIKDLIKAKGENTDTTDSVDRTVFGQ
ncbi:hypothetical protein G6F56_012549 [Rhizopus delemar]|nr:hypothetical protein G6F56_012549 [Rhizopus delemar]